MNTVQDLIDELEKMDPTALVRAGKYRSRWGAWDLEEITFTTLLTNEDGTEDLTDKERDRDIECLVIY